MYDICISLTYHLFLDSTSPPSRAGTIATTVIFVLFADLKKTSGVTALKLNLGVLKHLTIHN